DIGYFFRGRLDDVRISNRVRYTGQFTPPVRFERDPDTIALYTFEEGRGTTLRDTSGHGHDGTIYGARWNKVGELYYPREPDLQAADDRLVLAWTLALGGWAHHLDEEGRTVDVRTVSQIPTGDVRLNGINLENNANVTDENFATIA